MIKKLIIILPFIISSIVIGMELEQKEPQEEAPRIKENIASLKIKIPTQPKQLPMVSKNTKEENGNRQLIHVLREHQDGFYRKNVIRCACFTGMLCIIVVVISYLAVA